MACDLLCPLSSLHTQANIKLREVVDPFQSLGQFLTKQNLYTLAMRLPTTKSQMMKVLVGQKFAVDLQEVVHAILQVTQEFSALHIMINPRDDYAFLQAFLKTEEDDDDDAADQLNEGPTEDKTDEGDEVAGGEGDDGEREEGEGGPKEKDETLEELSGVQESRDLFDTSESDEMTARADNCGCNKIVCVCAQEESQSLLTDF